MISDSADFRSIIRAGIYGVVAALALATPPTAQAKGVRPADVVQAELRAGWRTVGGTHIAALHLRLAEGWITYWRQPGEGGLAPRIDWSETSNLASVQTHWPQPTVFSFNGYHSIGYERELVLPIEITPERPGQPIMLDAAAIIGVCRDICMPVELRLRGTLGTTAITDPVIEAAMTRLPGKAARAGLTAVRCTLEPGSNGALRLVAELDLPQIGDNERLVIELPESQSQPRDLGTQRSGATLRGEAMIPTRGRTPLAVDRSRLQLTVLSDSGAVDHRGCEFTP